ncbi:uncharacterized protein N0V89_001437 [Didymosphaeria variabile]|uniref:Uncharacterized protein n=1 Tax=Didymosphaeria variabile TaxID=1932322 RepID=A0A9W8XYE5_9PLEO|nr:uncharacterized protein N0V89_001437 [Didymosphaeria variabile]KAJ4360870.1 hypothetical protein N0V89_001437 [Didymosphaeria variabile]
MTRSLQTSLTRNKRSPYTKVEVLILKFASSDLDHDLRPEVDQIKAAFTSLNYDVRVLDIEMEYSWNHLKKDLECFLRVPSKNEETLQIVYYCGHGGHQPTSEQNQEATLVLSSHRRSKHAAFVWWANISDLIMESQSDTLVFLNCCDAGLAASSTKRDTDPSSKYRKTLIAAGGWNTKVHHHFFDPLCNILSRIARTGESISTETLKDKINRELLPHIRNKGGPPQAILHGFLRTSRRTIHFARLKNQSDPEQGPKRLQKNDQLIMENIWVREHQRIKQVMGREQKRRPQRVSGAFAEGLQTSWVQPPLNQTSWSSHTLVWEWLQGLPTRT